MSSSLISFPPIFTLQLNATTRRRQLEFWSEYLSNNVGEFRVSCSSPLFECEDIDRKLSDEFISKLFEYIIDQGLGEPEAGGSAIFFYKRRIPEWADSVHAWAVKCGRLNSVESIFNMCNGPDCQDETFYAMPEEIMRRVLRILEERGKCELITVNSSDITGVKFFP